MYCQRCGRDNDDKFAYCQGCGSPLVAQQPQQCYTPQGAGYYISNYASIGARFAASLIDGIILCVPIGIIYAILVGLFAFRIAAHASKPQVYSEEALFGDIFGMILGIGLLAVFSMIVSWAYFALMESSTGQGTIGKRILGIAVTDLQGNRISLGRATIRFIVKGCLSGIMLIGYIVAFFTDKKQALHDIMAGTLVLNKSMHMPVANYPPVNTPYPAYTPPQIPQVNSCRSCGRQLETGARFCNGCGVPV